MTTKVAEYASTSLTTAVFVGFDAVLPVRPSNILLWLKRFLRLMRVTAVMAQHMAVSQAALTSTSTETFANVVSSVH